MGQGEDTWELGELDVEGGSIAGKAFRGMGEIVSANQYFLGTGEACNSLPYLLSDDGE